MNVARSAPNWLSRTSRSCAIGALVALIAGLGSQPALAQDGAALGKAREQFRQAIAAEAAGNWGGALTLLREVAAVKMTPQVRYNIGLCEENLGQLVAALGDYELAAADAQAANADDVIRVVSGRLEPLRARIPKVVVERTESARLATISIDGAQLGNAMIGKELPVDPGSHVVEATARGYQAFQYPFDIGEKEKKTVEVALVAMPSTTDAGPVAATSGAAPASDRGVESDRAPNYLPYVVGGAGVASLAASGFFYMLRSGTMSDLDAACGANRDDCPADTEDTFDKGKTYTTVANVTLGLGIVGVGAGVVLYLTDTGSSKEPTTAAVGVSPTGPNASVGATFVGRF